MAEHRLHGSAGGEAPPGAPDPLPRSRVAPRPRPGGWRRWGRNGLRLGLVAFAACVALLFVLLQTIPLPPPPVLVASTVYGRHDEVVARLFLEDRVPLDIAEVPEYLVQAIIAVEDYRFYGHAGVDLLGIARAAVRNILAGKTVEGGSTITQQLARALYLTQRRTLARKVQEAVLALKLEKRYDKRQILELHMNQVYFGHGSYGVEVAAQTYFGKSAREVSVAEAALLAGILRSPEYYSPYRDQDLALKRRSYALERMAELGYLTPEEAETARREPLKLAGLRPRASEAPYFIDYLLAEVGQRHPEVAEAVYRAGYKIYTTLDLEMQRAANTAVATKLTRGKKDAAGVTQPQCALVALDPQTGYVLAMVGGRSYAETQLNRAAQAHRQPGSAFKPFLYAAVVDRGFTPLSQMVCEPVSFYAGPGQPDYTPVDYGEEKYHYAPLTVRQSIKVSDNVTAVRWAEQVGAASVVAYARRMGISSSLSSYLPIALGSFEVYPLELASGYATLANGGFRVEPMAVRRIVAPDGTVIEENIPRPQQALDARTAYVVTDMLRGVMGPGGTGAHLGWILGRPNAGKTGTTSESKDAWFVGFVPQVVACAYVGYDEPQRLWGPGGSLAGPIWAEFMRLALAHVPVADFPRPAGVITVPVCSETLFRANPTCPAFGEIFIEGTAPAEECPLLHPPAGEPGSTEGGPGTGQPQLPEAPGEEGPLTWEQWLEEVWEVWLREGGSSPLGP